MQHKDDRRRSAHRVALLRRVLEGDVELGHSCDMESANILFGDSNRPTLFICYPGSIEKLTLLGAIYYY
jgi:hypothetical protein